MMKKGLALNWTAGMIIAAIVLIIFLVYAFGLAVWLSGSIHDGMCRFSVFLHSNFMFNTKIKCERNLVTITPNKVKIDNKDKRVMIGGKSKGSYDTGEFNEAVKYALADQMFSCFDIYGRGNYDLLKSNAAVADVYCFVCADVVFSNDARGKSVSGFADYLREKKIKQQGLDMSYEKFLSSYKYNSTVRVMYLPILTYNIKSYTPDPNQVISTDKQYMVLFIGSKETWFNLITDVLFASGAHRPENYYTVNLMTREDAEKTCTYLYN